MNKRKVLFLCTGNTARSQMAEAFLRKHAGEAFEAYSAGYQPQEIHPLTLAVLNEVGLDTSAHYAKGLRQFMGRTRFDYAIIVCRRAEEQCPTVSADAARIERWLFDNPAAYVGSDDETIAKFRAVRDQIEARVKLWIAENTE